MPACVNCNRYVCSCAVSPRSKTPRRRPVVVSTPKLSVVTSVYREPEAIVSGSSSPSPEHLVVII